MFSTTAERRRPTALRRSALSLAGLGAAALTAGSLLLAPAATAAPTAPPADATDTAATPALTDEQALNASIEPSVVQLYIEWNGYVAFPTDEGTTWSDELSVASICTGFFVSETGQIATAGHCVDPVEGRRALVDTFLESLVADGWLLPEEAAGLAGTAYANWPVEGLDAGSDPERIVYAVQPKAVEGIAIEDPLAVQVVDFRPFEQGDVALLKADVTGTVPLPVSAADPTSGTAVTSIGFPGSVQSVVDATRVRASFKTGSVSSQQISDQGVPRTEINADLSGGMSGGPTVDALGNVVGVNSSKINGDQAFNFITDASDLHQWLTAKGVAPAPVNVPAPEPTAEPVAEEVVLDAEDEAALAIGVLVAVGAAVLGFVVTVALVVVLVVRRRRKTATRALIAPPAPMVTAPGPAASVPGSAPAPVPAAEGQPVAVVDSVGSVSFGPGAPAPYAPQGQPMAPVGVTTAAAAARTGTTTGFTVPAATVPTPPPAPAGFATTVLSAPPVAPSTTAAATCRGCGAPAVEGQRFCSFCGDQL